ncbi:Urb2/Npa2 family-domain-containing protein [Bisporella sp. PMI_857]|nr:Urb2/Npa2 family-domain-containing protein [Bisporella sp. PMI_857]
MASKSRVAQEKLVQLEKSNAPFEDQLQEAAKFLGFDFINAGRVSIDAFESREKERTCAVFGKEEWLLKWLLKKLQSPKDDRPRKLVASWALLTHLMRTLPLPTTARILVEKRFMPILRQTLEEAQKRVNTSRIENPGEIIDSFKESSSRKSKKRKRSGELVDPIYSRREEVELLDAIYATILTATAATEIPADEGPSAAFSAEYMKAVLTTTSEESAKILGLWLFFSNSVVVNDALTNIDMKKWLSPFFKIWELRSKGAEDLVQFSLHCTQHILPILRTLRRVNSAAEIWTPELEKLLAKNIMIPAKASYSGTAETDPDSDLLNILTRLAVILDADNATVLFGIAIASIQLQSNRRRRPEDESWLQAVFIALKSAMPPQRLQENAQAIKDMLSYAITNKVTLELPVLRSIVVEYAIPGSKTNWTLLSTIVKLDANTFLIGVEGEDLLQEVLKRITSASLEADWVAESTRKIVCDVAVDLMGEFAKARDLSGFLRHWYNQIVMFENSRPDSDISLAGFFSTWESDGLQAKLKDLLEPSLTVHQVTQVLDWLSAEVQENSNAVCLILEAIAGSISKENFVDAVGTRLYHVMFDGGLSENLGIRYKWRSWRLLSRCLSWLQPSHLDEISELWASQGKRFDILTDRNSSEHFLMDVGNTSAQLEALESLRCGCVAWSVAPEQSQMQSLAKEAMLAFLPCVARDVSSFLVSLQGPNSCYLGDELCNYDKDTLVRGSGWIMWASIDSVFVENPQVLKIAKELPGDLFSEMLEKLFWIVSARPNLPDAPYGGSNDWLYLNKGYFVNLWYSLLSQDIVQNDERLIGTIIDVLLSNQTHRSNALVNAPANNSLAVQSLLGLPIDVFSRKQRERILKSWLPDGLQEKDPGLSYDNTALDPLVLSLKIKIMSRPAFYEGSKYNDLVCLADAIASSNLPNLQTNTRLFKELISLTLSYVNANLSQSRNRTYAEEALEYLKKNIKKKVDDDDKRKDKWSYATVALLEVTLNSFAAKRNALDELGILSSGDMASMTESFRRALLKQLERSIKKAKKHTGDEQFRLIDFIIDALTAVGVDEVKLAALSNDAKNFALSLDMSESDLGSRISNFFSTHVRNEDGEIIDTRIGGDVASVSSRHALIKRLEAALDGKDQDDRLEILESLYRGSSLVDQLDTLLAAKNIIASYSRIVEDDSFDLSSAYSELCKHMLQAKGYRQFAIITETMEMILRTKGRAVSQWNIDSTLGGITIMCSRIAPALRCQRAGNIYLHLCRLLQIILISYRLKLQGHFHLVVQAMQSLLRCLFTPLAHLTAQSAKIFASPSWLPRSSTHQLGPRHAVAFTRLVTLICNPTVSSVTRSQHNDLTSATDKAKGIAGQHMQYVLSTYIRLRLDMKMAPAVREQITPGIYAIFDTTTKELRRAISEGLDGSGRAEFRSLYTDYTKFGKWKGA